MGLGEHVAGYRDEGRSLSEQVADLRAEIGRAHAENAELRRVIAEIDARQKVSPAGALTPTERKFLVEQAQEVRTMKKELATCRAELAVKGAPQHEATSQRLTELEQGVNGLVAHGTTREVDGA